MPILNEKKAGRWGRLLLVLGIVSLLTTCFAVHPVLGGVFTFIVFAIVGVVLLADSKGVFD